MPYARKSTLRSRAFVGRAMASIVAFTILLVAWPEARAEAQDLDPTQHYYPPTGDWERRRPDEVGMDPDLLAAAIEYARSQETSKPMDFSDQEEIFGTLLGPIPTLRAATNGIVVRRGYIVAEFGDTSKVDPTYSAAKSYLSSIAGLAVDRGLIADLGDPVSESIDDGGYDSPQNSKVTWHHHLQQTSEWEGELWGKKHDFVGSTAFGRGERQPRALQAPGSYYEYNDVRINRLALSLLRLWRKPLPEVLADEIMNPIGASDTWRYLGYDNANVQIDGRTMKSVTGGTRWGAGLWINSFDQARFGYLLLRGGRWQDRQILSEDWIRKATSRGPVGPDYGYLWWLDSEGKSWPNAPKTAFRAVGHGSNTVWIDPEHDLVVVWRWHQGRAASELYRRIIQSILSE